MTRNGHERRRLDLSDRQGATFQVSGISI
jgi:hypothetical protein